MRYIYTHTEAILQSYDGSLPLSHFLKAYFKKHPILGSRDRKILSDAAYCWYRASKGFSEDLPFEKRLHACLFLCDTQSQHTLRLLPEGLQEKPDSITQRLSILQEKGLHFDRPKLTSFPPQLSDGIITTDWLDSMLQQPRLFIRLRKQQPKIESLLHEAGIPYDRINGDCLSLPNGAAIDKLLPPDSYVVQDVSSQAVGNYYPTQAANWWDCCCGAGGKSLLLKDRLPKASITVTDVRASIIQNLLERFRKYGLLQPSAAVTDSADPKALKEALGNQRFDAIICDVPCTGSGTWARTPEGLYFFDESQIEVYAKRQEQIALNAQQYLKPGTTMLYITCSVFSRENEEVVNKLIAESGLKLQEQKLINGISLKADSMFVAVLKKL